MLRARGLRRARSLPLLLGDIEDDVDGEDEEDDSNDDDDGDCDCECCDCCN